MNRYRLPPHPPRSLDLRLVLEIGKTKVHPLGREEEAMGNDDGYLGHQILAPTDEDLCHGSPLEGARNFPIHGVEWRAG